MINSLGPAGPDPMPTDPSYWKRSDTVDWWAGTETTLGLERGQELVNFELMRNTVIMQIKRKIQFSARNSILRIYGRI